MHLERQTLMFVEGLLGILALTVILALITGVAAWIVFGNKGS
jgi:hypothetical protein